MDKEKYQFSGFTAPQYTPIPDIVFDELAHILSGGEYKVLMYILRRTFGFKKNSDSISYTQMLTGIVAKDGRRLDYGAGIKSRSTLSAAIKRLEALKIIIAIRNKSSRSGLESTIYTPNMGQRVGGNNPSPKIELAPSTKIEPALVQKSNQQYTALQKTENTTTSPPPQKPTSQPPAYEQRIVVALLVAKGIARSAAEKMAKTHNEAYTRRKIAFLEYLLVEAPERVKNPKGWLRKAIEDDYGAPDGYKSPEEIAAEKRKKQAEKARQIEIQAERIAKEESANEVQKRKKRARITAIHEQYKTTPEEIAAWQGVKMGLIEQLGGASASLLEDTIFATVDNEKAILIAPNGAVASLLNLRFKNRLETDLRDYGLTFDSIEIQHDNKKEESG